MIKNIYIIGAGQLGSRHLQALKLVNTPLKITVVDPSESSLKTARERYEGIPGNSHPIEFLQKLPKKIENIEIAIIPSSSNVRRTIIEALLSAAEVKFMILEKLLFNKVEDYEVISELIKTTGTKTFVNCAMRMIPFYSDAKKYFENQKITFSVTGSKYGLASNAIHYLDLISFYTGDNNFHLETSGLEFPMIESKRSGFMELTGTLVANYSLGSKAILSCNSDGTLPLMIEINGPETRLISREWEEKAWISQAKDNWIWREVEAKIPFQSQLTTELVNDLIIYGNCKLVSYEDSEKIHLNLLKGLDQYMLKNNFNNSELPFT